MPNTRETVRALVSAFNVHNYFSNTVETNFTLQSRGGKDYIVVSFDKSMGTYRFSEYLDSIKRKIIREFYGIEESNDAEILDTVKLIFDVNSFPFSISNRDWPWDKQHGFKFVAPVDQGVIFNLKSHLAASLAKDVLENMPTCNIRSSDRKDHLWRGEFPNKELRKEFERGFLFRMKERYENVSKNPLKIEGNSVYIKDVFDDARFINSVIRYKTWLTGMDLGVGNDVDDRVKLFKDMIIESIGQSTGVTIYGFVCASPLDRKEASILIPLVLDSGRKRILTNEEALELNYAFNYAVFNDLYGRTQGELSLNGSNGIYSIDFSNKEISHCVITKIIESSVINAKHELSIDPELRLQALSPAQSPVRVPNGPSSYFTEPLSPAQEFPSRGHGEELGTSPRRGLEKFPVLVQVNLSDVPEVSEKFPPRTYVSRATINFSVPGSSSPSQSLGAAKNVQASTSASSQQPNRWSLPVPSAGPSLWQPSRPSSWEGANPVGANPWSQPIDSWSSSASSAGLWSLPQSRPLSWEGASASDKPLNEEEKELFKALLYALNLNNQIFECHHTNFIVENGKIASLINDGVNVKEYLQKVRDYTIKEYCGTEEEAKEAYGLNEFPFKFLSNCEKNQETTVVANISCGALFNLKKLFIQKHEKKVEIEDIDINIVKKAVKSKKDKWVDSQVQQGMARPCEAITTCYPDESVLEGISIIEGKDKYYLDRTFGTWEVKSFLKERRCAKGTSKAEKMKSEDNKDSGYSSGFVTGAENVSSEAKATISGYESMDCENTRGGSPKRTLELSMGMEELAISTDLDATKVEQHSPIKKFRSN